MGELKNTVIVFSSDHGDMLGDYGQWSKLSPLQQSVGVPLIVAGSETPRREPYTDPVTILDLHATFLEIAGTGPGDRVDSRSIKDLLDGDAEHHREVVFSELGPWRLVYDGQHKLIGGYDPERRHGDQWEPQNVDRGKTTRLREQRDRVLYDVTDTESGDVSDAHPDIVDRLQTRLQ